MTPQIAGQYPAGSSIWTTGCLPLVAFPGWTWEQEHTQWKLLFSPASLPLLFSPFLCQVKEALPFSWHSTGQDPLSHPKENRGKLQTESLILCKTHSLTSSKLLLKTSWSKSGYISPSLWYFSAGRRIYLCESLIQ